MTNLNLWKAYSTTGILITVADGSLAAGTCTSELFVNAVSGDGNFDESDDFSRPASVTQGATVGDDRVTIYQSNTYIQGQPPLP